MGFWDWFKAFFSSEGVLVLDGVRIPKAYTPLKDWQKQHPGEEVDGNAIRVFQEKYTFVFDKDDPEFLAFLDQCKTDTKSLRVALEQELRSRELPFTVKSKPPASKRELGFLIRPPFFASSAEKEGRLEFSSLMFVFHFDENHILQSVRFSIRENDPVYAQFFKGRFHRFLMEKKNELSAAYGDWPVFARIVANVLEERGRTIKPVRRVA